MTGRPICGWGINDADYVVKPTINGKRVWCPFYTKWQNMVKRGHDKSYQQTHPTYIGCKIDIRWKYFMTFRTWMVEQDWEGMHFDKDILGNGKLYSPETCCFIPGWLNNLFTASGAKRGKYKIGVDLPKGSKRFRAQVSRGNPNPDHIGMFDTEEEAHQAYLKEKRAYVIKLMEGYPDEKIKKAVLEKV